MWAEVVGVRRLAVVVRNRRSNPGWLRHKVFAWAGQSMAGQSMVGQIGCAGCCSRVARSDRLDLVEQPSRCHRRVDGQPCDDDEQSYI
jgi:hypothetical protein